MMQVGTSSTTHIAQRAAVMLYLGRIMPAGAETQPAYLRSGRFKYNDATTYRKLPQAVAPSSNAHETHETTDVKPKQM